MALRYETGAPGGVVGIASVLSELQLPPGVFVDNHIVDFRGGGGAAALNVPGQLRAASTFVVEGVRHILEGFLPWLKEEAPVSAPTDVPPP